MIPPSRLYDANNEAQFRRQVYERNNLALSTDKAAPFVLLTDETTQEVVKVTVAAGVLVVTAL